jgi:glycopeptide antibiotics resistance protein
MTAAPAKPARAGAALVASFALYLALLTWTVLWKLEVPWVGGVERVIKLVPFVAVGDLGASRPSEVLINLALFVPFGVFLALVVPAWRWWTAVAVMAATSVFFEVTQYVLAIGSTDSTDVIVNTAGGAAGLLLVHVLRARRGARIDAVLARVCRVGVVVALVGAIVIATGPLRFGPPSAGHEGVAPVGLSVRTDAPHRAG